MQMQDHITFLLKNLYVGQETASRTLHRTMDWFKIGKGVQQGYLMSLCLFNLYAEHTTWNARLHEAQAEIKIARRNINNLRYADDTTLMAESENGLKHLWWEWKRRVKKTGLQLSIRKTKIIASSPITSWQIDEEKQIVVATRKLKDVCFQEEKLWQT